jgi:serine/threonine-protein kinase
MLQPGHIINDTYRVERMLGSGGMADVYIVAHMRMPRKFALKVMRLDVSTRQAFLERFNQEGEILATIRHPHIVDVIDRNQLPDGNPYLVMELLEGEDLAIYLARTGALSVPVALRICSQIGDALEAAHRVGVVHRDLKPSNIFLSQQGQVLNFVKVLDFGIAKLTSTHKLQQQMTAPAALMGTPAYMSPEQALSQSEKVDARTDQFALAAVLYEMLAGRGAFHQPGDAIFAILERVVKREPEPLKEPQINRAVMRALSKRPEDRFPSLGEFLAAVGATTHTVYGDLSQLRNSPGTLSNQIGEHAPSAQQRGLRRAIVASLAMGVVAGSLLLALERRPPAAHLAVAPPARLLPPAPAPPPAPAASPPAAPPAPATPELGPTAAATVPAESSPASSPRSPAPAASSEAKKPRPAPPVRTPHLFTILNSGKASHLDPIILGCARDQLGAVPLREGTLIKLERSGTLAVVEAPAVVYESSFNVCLRQVLSRITHSVLPKTVTIKVIK